MKRPTTWFASPHSGNPARGSRGFGDADRGSTGRSAAFAGPEPTPGRSGLSPAPPSRVRRLPNCTGRRPSQLRKTDSCPMNSNSARSRPKRRSCPSQVAASREDRCPRQRRSAVRSTTSRCCWPTRWKQVGTSGVGKVEVWITRDKCKTWQKFCEDPHRKSPVAIELPVRRALRHHAGGQQWPRASGYAAQARRRSRSVDRSGPDQAGRRDHHRASGRRRRFRGRVHRLRGQGSQPGHRFGRTVLLQQP